MANPLPPNNIMNQLDLAPVILESALVNEEEEEFEDEEEEEENEPELTFPYKEADPLNPSPPTSDLETEDVVESEDMVEPEGEIVPNSVHAIEERVTALEDLIKKSDGQTGAPIVRECTFTGFMKCNLTTYRGKKVKFAAATLQGPALTWWNSKLVILGFEAANQIPWVEMKKLMTEEFCPAKEIQRMEHELWNLKNIKGEVTSSKPTNLSEAVRMAHKLMEQKFQAKKEIVVEGIKRKWENSQVRSSRCNYRDNNHNSQQNYQRQGNARAITNAPNEMTELVAPAPTCARCGPRHYDCCPPKCHQCGKFSHRTRDCKSMTIATGANTQHIWTCYDCSEQGYVRNQCLKKKNNSQGGNAHGRAYVMKEGDKNQGPNVVTGTFLLNNHYAFVLFDSGSDNSFVNTRFSHLIDINRDKLDVSYEVELADGKVVSTNTVLRGCILILVNHLFEINLMPIELGTFDVIIRIDWLVERDVVIVCGKKVVHIPCGNKTLIVEGDKGTSRLKVKSCIKARKYIERGCQMFVAYVTKKKSKEKRLEDVPVIHDFPEVFPDDLSGLPPPRQVEF
ncbi:putative reverse transcriptase domain-containing protein [Tanacetum coccineum]